MAGYSCGPLPAAGRPTDRSDLVAFLYLALAKPESLFCNTRARGPSFRTQSGTLVFKESFPCCLVLSRGAHAVLRMCHAQAP